MTDQTKKTEAALELIKEAKKAADDVLVLARENAANLKNIAREEATRVVREDVAHVIRVEVNGKIDEIRRQNSEQTLAIEGLREFMNEHNIKHEESMNRILPVVEAFESAQGDLATARRGGKIVLWLAATITAIGGSLLVIRELFFR